ncbi:MAG TPA: hypothetical protein VGB92_15870 [Longimicrobium sp.]|jgi:hypothetical protein
MKKYFDPRFLLAFAMILAAGACASTSGGGQAGAAGERQRGVSIEIENTGTLSGDLTVYVVGLGGSRQLLGSVAPNRNATLEYRGPVIGGQYRLLARPNGGRDILSNPFSFGGATTIRWNLQSNIAVAVD